MIEVGQEAPRFELPDNNGQVVKSEDFVGQWLLLYWYPKADTPGCAAQAQGLRDQMDLFVDANCRVVGASFDRVDEIAAFHEKFHLNFPLLADPDRVAGTLYGVAGPDGDSRYAARIAYLIDPAGKVAAAMDVDDPEFFADRALDVLEGMMV